MYNAARRDATHYPQCSPAKREKSVGRRRFVTTVTNNGEAAAPMWARQAIGPPLERRNVPAAGATSVAVVLEAAPTLRDQLSQES
jgi:hypothetical protein